MSQPPPNPSIYHITHINNLPGIITSGGLCADAAMTANGVPAATVGMGKIKRRRLQLPVKCHEGDFVGDYVPFYFCPRSIMLYLIHCADHPEMTYRGGQDPIVHLQADLHQVVAWANSQAKRWAFTLSNAGAVYTEFRDDLTKLHEMDWLAVDATDFRPANVKEGKQAEFLLHEFFPWHLVRRIRCSRCEYVRKG